MSEPTDPLAPDDPAAPTQVRGADQTAPVSRFAPGQAVPFRPSWTLVKELGRGGFGEVWQTKHEWRDELGAVKFCTHPDARVQLVSHEKKVIVRVMRYAGDHPHIVPLLDYDLSGEVPWLMYQYVQGGTLADAVESWRELPVARRLGRAVLILYGITRALKRVHRLEPPIVHRDLKPANVLLDRGLPRVTDFGIGGTAALSGATEAPGRNFDASVQLPTMLKSMGTFRYAPQEQMLGSPPNPRDDVYALGIMAYQLALADLNAIPGTDAADILRGLQAPKELISLIVRSVAMDPTRRPKDAREWEVTLRSWVPRKGDSPGTMEVRALDSGTTRVPARTIAPPTVSHAAATPTPTAAVPAPTEPSAAPAPPAPTAPDRVAPIAPVPFEAATVALTVPGALLARPDGAPDAAWSEVAKLPASVNLVPAQVYCLRVKETAADADLAAVQALPARAPVRHLNLSWCAQLTDAALAHLKDMYQLQSLELTGCKKVTNAGFGHLAALTDLEHLNLRWCALVTDAGLAQLRKLTALRHLDLMGCGELTDAGLAHVRGFTKLKNLNLRWCEQITDAGLAHLLKLSRLRNLSLWNCPRVTDAGLAKLKAALPKCAVER